MNHIKGAPAVFLVIPTIRNLNFLASWGDEFADCHIVIVEDHEQQEIETPSIPSRSIHHYSWSDIDSELGKHAWIIPRRNAGIRSFGFWKAHELGAQVVITLDDDCYPEEPGFVHTHLENLSSKAPTRWFSTYPDPAFLFTRGFPYRVRDRLPVVISHGLWSGVVDLDAKTLLNYPQLDQDAYPPFRQYVPLGSYFPMSSMNLAFTRDAIPLMYFPLMGEDASGNAWGFDRFDDIWAGIFAKKIVDHLGWAVVNGSPFVRHRGDSDRNANLRKEKDGLVVNERLWKLVDEVRLTERTSVACYLQLAGQIRFPRSVYFARLRRAMTIWADLFDS